MPKITLFVCAIKSEFYFIKLGGSCFLLHLALSVAEINCSSLKSLPIYKPHMENQLKAALDNKTFARPPQIVATKI